MSPVRAPAAHTDSATWPHRKRDPEPWLNFAGLPAQVTVGLFISVQFATYLLVLPENPAPWPTAASAILGVVAIFLASRPGIRALSIGTTSAVALLAIGAFALTLPQPPGNSLAGYTTAHMGVSAFALLLLALRGRVVAAWLAFIVVSIISVGYCIGVGEELAPRLHTQLTSGALLLLGTLLVEGFAQMSRRLVVAQARQDEASAERTAAEQTATAQLGHVSRLLDAAGPLLARIAAGEELTDADRRECLVAEALLRDSSRAPHLAFEPLTGAVRAARTRGVTVVLYDDRSSQLPPLVATMLADWLVALLAPVRDGTVTVRLLPLGREALATLTTSDGETSLTREFTLAESPPVPDPIFRT